MSALKAQQFFKDPEAGGHPLGQELKEATRWLSQERRLQPKLKT